MDNIDHAYSQAESVRHIFQECSYSKTVSLDIQRTNRYLAQNNFFARGEYQRAILESNQKGVKQMQVVFCFVLWRERCARIFRDEQKPPQILANEMRREYTSWFLESQTQTGD